MSSDLTCKGYTVANKLLSPFSKDMEPDNWQDDQCSLPPSEVVRSTDAGVTQRPTSVRPGTCKNATAGLSGDVAVETKYDGERYIPQLCDHEAIF